MVYLEDTTGFQKKVQLIIYHMVYLEDTTGFQKKI